MTLEQRHYQRLLDFRTGLRRFLRWSADQAATVGVTPAQHQLLLAVRGHPDPAGPTIRDVAGYLLVRHHSAVELVDRAVAAGLVERPAARLASGGTQAARATARSAVGRARHGHRQGPAKSLPSRPGRADWAERSTSTSTLSRWAAGGGRADRQGRSTGARCGPRCACATLRPAAGVFELVEFGQRPPDPASQVLEVGQHGHADDRPEHEPEDSFHLLLPTIRRVTSCCDIES